MATTDVAEIKDVIEINTTSLVVSAKTCKLCELPEIEQANNIYADSGEDAETVGFWLKKRLGIDLLVSEIEDHFGNHYKPLDGQLPLPLERQLEHLRKRISSTDRASSGSKITIIKEMMWEFLVNIYAYKPQRMKTDSQIDKHSRLSKQFAEMAKAYRELHEMELKVLGYGKTEEEQLDLMRNYVKSMLKKVIDHFEDMPEAQRRLSEIINISMSSSDKKE